jgi:hypothetical protein
MSILNSNSGVKIVVKKTKFRDMALKMVGKAHDAWEVAMNVEKICNIARLSLIPNTEQDLMEAADYYNYTYKGRVIEICLILLDLENMNREIIDFTDMIYQPVILKPSRVPDYQIVYCDEAQDMSKAAIALVEMLVSPRNGRLISIADPCQSIYGFAGANADAYEYLTARPNTRTLTLPISYRCAKSIVRKAQEVNNVIMPWDESPEGETRYGQLAEVKADDLVLCRNTAPLVAAYLTFIERGLKAHIVGKDIDAGLLEMAESLSKFRRNDEALLELDDQKEEILVDLIEKGWNNPERSVRYQTWEEKYDVCVLLLQKVVKSPRDLPQKIRDIFNPDAAGATLMTIHRSKGLEFNRVFLIERYKSEYLIPSKYAETEWQLKQESNLLFVAYTRAKKSLIFIDNLIP